jgi:NAD(P)-dependent dehydrogenase (short-subunit alcohol dehydrogenase family)
MGKTLLIVGGSRGLGDGFSRGLPSAGDTVLLASRGRPRSLAVDDGVRRRWIELDVASADAPERLRDALGDGGLDAVVYNAGLWEESGFSAGYRFEVLVGSTSGLPHAATREVAYSASKFGLRGVAHALRPTLRESGIAVTCVNPGWISSDVPYEEGPEAVLAARGRACIPLHDVVSLVRCVLSLSPAACVKEIDMPAMAETNA